MSTVLFFVVAAAGIYAFLNGYKDAAGITATVIASRALSLEQSLAIIALAEFCGPFLFGLAVATTVGQDIIVQSMVTPAMLIAALLSAVMWNLAMALLGVPSSSTHALVGGLVGAALAESGPAALQYGGLARLVLALLLSPVAGLMLGYGLLKLVYFLAQSASPRINVVFKRVQIVTAVALAVSHGSNDAQKSIGLIALGLVLTGRTSTFQVPLWVTLVCAAALASGALIGGRRVIRTVGSGIYRLRPVHSFTAQIASTIIVLGAGLLGGPVSTSQVVSSAIMGVGSAERLSRVRWLTAGNIALAWLITLPAAALLAAALWLLLSRLIGNPA